MSRSLKKGPYINVSLEKKILAMNESGKKNVVTMEYHSAIKRNTFESGLMRWMNLEPIIQCEVSQKEKYRILMHIYGT